MAIQADIYRAKGEVYKYPLFNITGLTADTHDFLAINMSGCNSIKVQSIYQATTFPMECKVVMFGSLDEVNFSALPSSNGTYSYSHRASVTNFASGDRTFLYYTRPIPFIRLSVEQKVHPNASQIQLNCFFT